MYVLSSPDHQACYEYSIPVVPFSGGSTFTTLPSVYKVINTRISVTDQNPISFALLLHPSTVLVTSLFGLSFLFNPKTASLEGHFDAPSFPIKGSQEKKSPIALEDLKTGPTLVLDFGANMNEILEVHDRDMDVVVQPGMPYELLNEELKEKGLFFPVDVSFFYVFHESTRVYSRLSISKLNPIVDPPSAFLLARSRC